MRRRESHHGIRSGSSGARRSRARAQQPERMRRIGALRAAPRAPERANSRRSARDCRTQLGWTEGDNFRMVWFRGGGDAQSM